MRQTKPLLTHGALNRTTASRVRAVQTGQGYVGGPGFCSISPAKRIREWRSGEVSHSYLRKMLVLWLRLPCVGRAPSPREESRVVPDVGLCSRRRCLECVVNCVSLSPPGAPPPRAGPLREWPFVETVVLQTLL